MITGYTINKNSITAKFPENNGLNNRTGTITIKSKSENRQLASYTVVQKASNVFSFPNGTTAYTIYASSAASTYSINCTTNYTDIRCAGTAAWATANYASNTFTISVDSNENNPERTCLFNIKSGNNIIGKITVIQETGYVNKYFWIGSEGTTSQTSTVESSGASLSLSLITNYQQSELELVVVSDVPGFNASLVGTSQLSITVPVTDREGVSPLRVGFISVKTDNKTIGQVIVYQNPVAKYFRFTETQSKNYTLYVDDTTSTAQTAYETNYTDLSANFDIQGFGNVAFNNGVMVVEYVANTGTTGVVARANIVSNNTVVGTLTVVQSPHSEYYFAFENGQTAITKYVSYERGSLSVAYQTNYEFTLEISGNMISNTSKTDSNITVNYSNNTSITEARYGYVYCKNGDNIIGILSIVQQVMPNESEFYWEVCATTKESQISVETESNETELDETFSTTYSRIITEPDYAYGTPDTWTGTIDSVSGNRFICELGREENISEKDERGRFIIYSNYPQLYVEIGSIEITRRGISDFEYNLAINGVSADTEIDALESGFTIETYPTSQAKTYDIYVYSGTSRIATVATNVSGNYSGTYECGANTSTTDRRVYKVVATNDIRESHLIVTQNPKSVEKYFRFGDGSTASTISGISYNSTYTACTVNTNYNENELVFAYSGDSGCTCNYYGYDSMLINYSQNNEPDDREYLINVYHDEVAPENLVGELTIIQLGKPAEKYIYVDEQGRTSVILPEFDSTGSSDTVLVLTNYSYNEISTAITNNNNWVNYTLTDNGDDTMTLSITADAQPTGGNERNGSITISKGSKNANISIKQRSGDSKRIVLRVNGKTSESIGSDTTGFTISTQPNDNESSYGIWVYCNNVLKFGDTYTGTTSFTYNCGENLDTSAKLYEIKASGSTFPLENVMVTQAAHGSYNIVIAPESYSNVDSTGATGLCFVITSTNYTPEMIDNIRVESDTPVSNCSSRIITGVTYQGSQYSGITFDVGTNTGTSPRSGQIRFRLNGETIATKQVTQATAGYFLVFADTSATTKSVTVLSTNSSYQCTIRTNCTSVSLSTTGIVTGATTAATSDTQSKYLTVYFSGYGTGSTVVNGNDGLSIRLNVTRNESLTFVWVDSNRSEYVVESPTYERFSVTAGYRTNYQNVSFQEYEIKPTAGSPGSPSYTFNSANDSLTVSISDDNPTETQRYVKLIARSNGNDIGIIQVNQKPIEYFFKFDNDQTTYTESVGGTAGSTSVGYTTNYKTITLDYTSDWLSATTNNGSVSIAYSANQAGGAARSCNIRVKGTKYQQVDGHDVIVNVGTLTVQQEAGEIIYVLINGLSEDRLENITNVGGTLTNQYTITTNASNISVDYTSGTNSWITGDTAGTLTVAQQEVGGNVRSGGIYFKASPTVFAKLNVSQSEGDELYIYIDGVTAKTVSNISSDGDSFDVSVTTNGGLQNVQVSSDSGWLTATANGSITVNQNSGTARTGHTTFTITYGNVTKTAILTVEQEAHVMRTVTLSVNGTFEWHYVLTTTDGNLYTINDAEPTFYIDVDGGQSESITHFNGNPGLMTTDGVTGHNYTAVTAYGGSSPIYINDTNAHTVNVYIELDIDGDYENVGGTFSGTGGGSFNGTSCLVCSLPLSAGASSMNLEINGGTITIYGN